MRVSRVFYPNNYRLIFIENMIPVFFALMVWAAHPGALAGAIRLCVYYYFFALIHYLYLQPLRMTPDEIEGPAGFLLWRQKIFWASAVVREDRIWSFKVLKIIDADTEKSIVCFSNYFMPHTFREIERELKNLPRHSPLEEDTL